jgi:hypothetical protein
MKQERESLIQVTSTIPMSRGELLHHQCHHHGAEGVDVWYVANVSIIFDAPRCHSASSCFLLFFYSRFLLKEIFSELDKTKAKVPIYLTRRQSPKERRRRAMSRPHLVVVWPSPWPRHPIVWAPRAPTDLALPPINSHLWENPKPQTSIHEKVM